MAQTILLLKQQQQQQQQQKQQTNKGIKHTKQTQCPCPLN
jgi:hypothetical protein